MNNRNLGFFTIKAGDIKSSLLDIAEIFSRLKIVPLRCEFRPDLNAFEYLAISERFQEISEGMMAPNYEFRIIRSKAGNIELIEVYRL